VDIGIASYTSSIYLVPRYIYPLVLVLWGYSAFGAFLLGHFCCWRRRQNKKEWDLASNVSWGFFLYIYPFLFSFFFGLAWYGLFIDTFFLLFCHREVRSYVGWISDLFSWRSPDEGKGGDGWMVDDG